MSVPSLPTKVFPTDSLSKEVAFLMGDIPEWEVLAASLGTTIEIIHIDASADGLEQIAQWADAHHDYETIRIFSHGGNGTLHLGTLTLQDGNIGEHAHALQRIGAALVETGDVLLYGCDVAQDKRPL